MRPSATGWLFSLLLCGGIVLAATAAPANAQPSDVEAEAANALNDKAIELYQKKRYEQAAKLFLRAYQGKPLAKYLFNFAQATAKTGNCPRAVAGFRLYRKQAIRQHGERPSDKRMRESLALAEKTATQLAKKCKQEAAEQDDEVVLGLKSPDVLPDDPGDDDDDTGMVEPAGDDDDDDSGDDDDDVATGDDDDDDDVSIGAGTMAKRGFSPRLSAAAWVAGSILSNPIADAQVNATAVELEPDGAAVWAGLEVGASFGDSYGFTVRAGGAAVISNYNAIDPMGDGTPAPPGQSCAGVPDCVGAGVINIFTGWGVLQGDLRLGTRLGVHPGVVIGVQKLSVAEGQTIEETTKLLLAGRLHGTVMLTDKILIEVKLVEVSQDSVGFGLGVGFTL